MRWILFLAMQDLCRLGKSAVLGMKHLEPWFNSTLCSGETFNSMGKKLQCCEERGSGHV
jgi:hypothetical protein